MVKRSTTHTALTEAERILIKARYLQTYPGWKPPVHAQVLRISIRQAERLVSNDSGAPNHALADLMRSLTDEQVIDAAKSTAEARHQLQLRVQLKQLETNAYTDPPEWYLDVRLYVDKAAAAEPGSTAAAIAWAEALAAIKHRISDKELATLTPVGRAFVLGTAGIVHYFNGLTEQAETLLDRAIAAGARANCPPDFHHAYLSGVAGIRVRLAKFEQAERDLEAVFADSRYFAPAMVNMLCLWRYAIDRPNFDRWAAIIGERAYHLDVEDTDYLFRKVTQDPDLVGRDRSGTWVTDLDSYKRLVAEIAAALEAARRARAKTADSSGDDGE